MIFSRLLIRNSSISKRLISNTNHHRTRYVLQYHTKPPLPEQTLPRPEKYKQSSSKTSNTNKNDDFKVGEAIFLGFLPIVALGLGVWQYYRLGWKLKIIDDMKSHTHMEAIPLPKNSGELDQLAETHEYYPFKVRGHFLHEKEALLTTRYNLTNDHEHMQKSGFSMPNAPEHGAYVITPFKLADRDMTILVNRGFVPMSHFDSNKRLRGQVEGQVELVGILRTTETHSSFIPADVPPREWHNRDVAKMAREMGTAPIFLDAVAASSVPGGPIGGQTNVYIRNQHWEYMMTWFSLSAITTAIWFFKYGMRLLPR